MDDTLRQQATRALGLAINLAERSLEYLVPGAPVSPVASGVRPLQSLGVANVLGSPHSQPGSGVQSSGAWVAPMPVVQPGPPPSYPPVSCAGGLGQAVPAVPAATGRFEGTAVHAARPARSRSRHRRHSQRDRGTRGHRRHRDEPARRVQAVASSHQRSHRHSAVSNLRASDPRTEVSRAAPASARPVFRGDLSSEATPAGFPDRSTHEPRAISSSAPLSRRSRARVLAGSQDRVVVVDPEPHILAQPAGLYLRGLPAGISVNGVRRLYEILSSRSATLQSLLPQFTMRQFTSGAAIVMHPAFGSRAVVAAVLQELGASGTTAAALPTSVGQLEIRQAREVQDLTEDE